MVIFDVYDFIEYRMNLMILFQESKESLFVESFTI